MRPPIFVILCTLSSVAVHAADARWSRMESPNFEMYTTAGERAARETLRYFEQVHGFFAQTMPSAGNKTLPVRIVAFNSAKEYEPYRMNEVAIAYYHGTADCDYIVMSHTGSETFPVAVHEYVHLIARHANMKLPPWLGEGIAELYSTLRPMNDKILVGSLIAGRHYALLNEKWVPLETILSVDSNSPYYNEKNKANNLYNEGWALTHMLALDNQYRGKFSQVMRDISAGTPSRAALENAYGKPLAAIEKDLLSYLRGGRFQGVLIPAKLEKLADDLSARPADDFDVKLLLTRLTNRPDRRDATQKSLEELIALDPKRPEPHIDLGYLFWSRDRRDDAAAEFGKAYDLGSRGPRLLWDYGRLAESRSALSELLKLEPDRLEVRLELAQAQLRANAPKDAAETLKPVKKVTPDDAPRLLSLVAVANYQSGDRLSARNAAEQLRKVARSAEDRNTADQILNALAAPTAVAPAPNRKEEGPPRIVRRERPEMTLEVRTERPQRPSFAGKFVELQCTEPAKIVLSTADGNKIILIDDPTRILIDGQNGQTMDLSCGAQKPRSVRVEYDPPGDRRGIDGLARAIHFE